MKLSPFVCSTFSIALFAAACGGDDQATQEDYDDIASSTAALMSNEPSGESEAAGEALMAARGGPRGQIKYLLNLTCRDAGGAELSMCNGADSAHVVVSWTGMLNTLRRTATVERHGDWTLTGLQSAEAELNGTGDLHADGTFTALHRTDNRTWTYDYAAEYQAVKINIAERKITGGKVVYEINAQKRIDRERRDVERTLHVNAEVVFLGDGQAQITLDKERHYKVTLSDGTVVAEQ